MNNTNNLLSPLPREILDEIGLEGLDGITLEGNFVIYLILKNL